jgi:hypothetical protein
MNLLSSISTTLLSAPFISDLFSVKSNEYDFLASQTIHLQCIDLPGILFALCVTTLFCVMSYIISIIFSNVSLPLVSHEE